jgi:glycolate oxidase iron-sulfur subunit
MQTTLAEKYKNQTYTADAEHILGRCVHCGFCNATCPTFQLTGDELEGPRGRIYVIKGILEGASPTLTTRNHLDRCLACQSCETTCPSGVQYSRLLEIGRQLHNEVMDGPFVDKWTRILLRKILLRPQLFKLLLLPANTFGFLIPKSLKKHVPPLGKVPADKPYTAISTSSFDSNIDNKRTLIMLRGCAQQVCVPEINYAAAELFNQLGFNVVESIEDKCCGALSHHNDATEEARELARQNIDAWWPLIEQGAESIVVTASGCATTVREYDHLLKGDAKYSDKAKRIVELCRDPLEILEGFSDQLKASPGTPQRISYQAPCTQQHGLGIRGRVEQLLQSAGFELTQQKIGHICCGSAGSYSTLQPKLSSQLQKNKLDDLTREKPDLIATANIGCLLHLQSGTDIPVKHWLQIIDVNKPE